MKKILFSVILLMACHAGYSQEQQGQKIPDAKEPVRPVAADDNGQPVDTLKTKESVPAAEYRIIDGRKVRVDNQGVQSLEVVEPTPAVKPKQEEGVK